MPLFSASQHKKWLDALPRRPSSAAMMLENDVHELLIVKANYKTYWTLPGGLVDADETPKQAAIRETREEVGIAVNPDDAEFVAVVNRISTELQTYQFLFKAKVSAGDFGKIVLQASEIDDYMFIKRSDVKLDDHLHAKAIQHWANGETGYIEQMFEEGS